MKKIIAGFFVLSSMLFLQGCGNDDDDVDVIIEDPPVTIVDTAVANGNFTTLIAALQATGLDRTLDDPNSTFTVFAPTDDAFALLGADTIAALLDDTDTLTGILTYHVLAGAVPASAAINAAGTSVETVNGASVGLSLAGDSLLVNTSTVTMTDIETDNGIIHVIDAVLIPPTERGEPSANIVDTAVGAGSFSILVDLLVATGLDTVLADTSANFTVFAPTDAAFEMIDDETVAVLLDNPDVLRSILLQHVLPVEANSIAAFTLNGQSVETASGAMIPIAIDPDTNALSFGGVNVSATDIYTTNGIIHVLDAVVIGDVEIPEPPQSIVDVAVESGAFPTLVAALQATGLDTALADLDAEFTVFAPSEEAFALLGDDTIAALLNDADALSNILLYHVVPGAPVASDAAIAVAQSSDNLVTTANGQNLALSLGGSTLFVNKSAVSQTDIMAGNGVIHIVDQVILPPAMRGEPTQSIVDVALGNPDFSTLVTALSAANLVDTLADESATFTVFAPTNAAFSKIDSNVLNALLNDVDALTAVLTQHVIADAEISSVAAFAANGANVDTVSGEDVSVALVNFASAMTDMNSEIAYDAANQRLVGGMASANPGFTLYTFDGDLGSSSSNCSDGCAAAWPPVLVSDGEVGSLPGVSVIERADGTMQAAYLGRPLYFFANDSEAGQANGEGVNNVWFVVNQEQVSLQIQGSNVTMTDIYTTNGVIHVIDTVITETLE